MKIMYCPVNGARPISEFVYGGQLRPTPVQSVDDYTWADYVFNRNSALGVQQEWWCHTPSNTWFIAERNTLTDKILNTYLFNQETQHG